MTPDQGLPQNFTPVAAYGVDTRATFIWRTYLHVIGAILAFTLIEMWIFQSGLAEPIAQAMLGGSWLLVLGAFMLASWGATHLAHRVESKPAQYAGLALLVSAEAIIFVPMLFIANTYAPGVISSAAMCTLMGTAGLTVVAFVTRRDFSFMRGMMMWGGILAMVAIVASILFGFELGTWFSVAMIGFAGAAILYDTSNILHHYPEDRYVGAAMQLFASVALMFWYAIQFFLASRD